MAVMPMKSICVYGLNEDRKAILEALQRLGTVEIKSCDLDSFSKPDTSSECAIFQKSVNECETALGILEKAVPEKKSMLSALEGKKQLESDLYYTFVDNTEEIMRVAKRIIALSKANEERNSQVLKLKMQKESLESWLLLDVETNLKGTRYTRTIIGSFPQGYSRQELYEKYQAKLAEQGLDDERYAVEIEIVDSVPMQTCVFMVCIAEFADEIEGIFRSIGFVRISDANGLTPVQSDKKISEKIKSIENRIDDGNKEIVSYQGMRNALKFISDYYSMRIEKYKALAQISRKKHVFAIMGYCTSEDAENTKNVLSYKYNAYVEIEDIPDDETAPVKLKNGFVTMGAETVLESFSLPNKREIDPTKILAFFYYTLFGLMLTDAAYGLIIAIGCMWALKKYKNMEIGMRKTLTMFFWCGVSTIFWGIIFGGYFGDAIDVVAKTFFHSDFRMKPVLFSPLDEPMKMMVLSLGFGVLHIFAGMGIALYQKAKAKDYVGAVFDVGCWYMVIGGLVAAFATTPIFAQMLGMTENFAPFIAKPALIIALIGALGIVFMAGRSSKNPLVRLAKGLYELYGATSYFSDILSYSRLLALGLATGVVASIFNQMGVLAGDGPIGVALFVVVFLIGNVLNIAINFLGAYVHTNRLQYVEFFGKFYEGGGKKFNPFSEKTKHFNITEEIEND